MAKRSKKWLKTQSVIYLEMYVFLGPAALVCAETLRQEDFKGHIVIATKDKHLPYDRPKLSKVNA